MRVRVLLLGLLTVLVLGACGSSAVSSPPPGGPGSATAMIVSPGSRLSPSPSASTSQPLQSGSYRILQPPMIALDDATATQLKDQRILIVSGSGHVLVPSGAGYEYGDGAASLPYDPAIGTFSLTGSPAEPRYACSATLLADGRVLLVGGNRGPNVASAELYDPVSGHFSPTGSMTAVRLNHTANLLTDGRVLIVGGDNEGQDYLDALVSAEIYDPETARFSETGSLSTERTGHTATLLPDGRVLVVGGTNDTSGEDLSTAEMYDPKTGKFGPTGSMSAGRAGHTATLLLDGRVLVVGGLGLDSAETYDPKTGKFTPTGSVPEGFEPSIATRLADGRVLIAGAEEPDLDTAAVIYDPTTGEFGTAGLFPTAHPLDAATLLPSGQVLLIMEDWSLGVGNPSLPVIALYQP